jgi:hypothetical protein
MVDLIEVEKKIDNIKYTKINENTLVCTLVLKSGFEITEINTNIKAEHFKTDTLNNRNIAESIVFHQALTKLAEYETYYQAEDEYEYTNAVELNERYEELLKLYKDLSKKIDSISCPFRCNPDIIPFIPVTQPLYQVPPTYTTTITSTTL